MKNTIPALIIIFLVLAGAGLLLYKAKQGIEGFTAIFPGLAEELAPEQVVLETTLTIQPGKVLQLTPGPEGYKLEEKVGYSLVERLTLDNVDLQPNDVVAASLYVWYFDGVDDYVSFDVGSVSPVHTVAFKMKLLEAVTVSPSNTFSVIGKGDYPHMRIYWYKNGYAVLEVHNETGTCKMCKLTPPSGYADSLNVWRVYAWKSYSVGSGVGVETYVDGELQSQFSEGGYVELNNTYPLTIGYSQCSMHSIFSYMIIWEKTNAPTSETHEPSSPKILIDPTFYNGTHYIDLIQGTIGTPQNGVIRIPAENPFLWHIKNLKSDNKLHFQWFPAGSIVRVIDANGFVREWTVSGNATVEGQVEDFAVSVDFDVLPNASIEAIVPSLKARFYVPQGFTVKLEAADGTAYSAVSSGYADIAVPEGEYTVKIIASSIETKDYAIEWSRSGSSLEIKVYDQGFPVTHALVIVKDPVANEVLAYGETDASGSVEFSEINAAAVEVEVHKLQDGIYYHDSETIQLTTQITASPSPMSGPADNRRATYIAIGVFVIALIAVIVAVARRR